MKNLKEKIEKILNWTKNFIKMRDVNGIPVAPVIIGSIAVIGGCIYGWCKINEYGTKVDRLVNQVKPYVEMYDGKPGISFEDYADFYKRAGFESYDIREGNTMRFENYSAARLEKALKSYQAEYENK